MLQHSRSPERILLSYIYSKNRPGHLGHDLLQIFPLSRVIYTCLIMMAFALEVVPFDLLENNIYLFVYSHNTELIEASKSIIKSHLTPTCWSTLTKLFYMYTYSIHWYMILLYCSSLFYIIFTPRRKFVVSGSVLYTSISFLLPFHALYYEDHRELSWQNLAQLFIYNWWLGHHSVVTSLFTSLSVDKYEPNSYFTFCPAFS